MLALFGLALALQQEPAVLDTAVYENAAWRIALPRPFADWVFAPATERGTTTVIFQPKHGALSDQLWGALVLTPWGRPVPLDDVADRRLDGTWRRTLGATFVLLTRDSLTVEGWPAIHIVVGGAINRAVLDIEEFLISRDSDLIVLQLRYPRGVPRDSISVGYQRVVRGLRIGGAAPLSGPTRRRAAPWNVQVERGQLRFDLPEEFRAVAPGALTADVASEGRRLMLWRPLIGELDTSLFAVGPYRFETRRVGRLTVRIWREESGDTLLAPVTDEMVALVARAWRTYWHDFGPLPVTEVALVETAWPVTRGSDATLFVGRDRDAAVLARELSRAWWGGAVRADRHGAALVRDALPRLAASLVAGDSSSARSADEQLQALARARAIAGEARFREAVRALVLESRGAAAAVSVLLRILGPIAAAPLSQLVEP